MKVAIVHDWLNQYGGAELVLEALKELFPDAPIYTSIYNPKAMPPFYQQWDIRTSFMDKLPFVKTHHQPFLLLYPLAFESFNLSQYDLVISNKSGFCHGVITGPDTVHICYCLTPTRFVWDFHEYVKMENIGPLARKLLPLFLLFLRQWDRLAADRVDFFIAISKEVKKRIYKFYHRTSEIIYPPIYTSRFHLSSEQDDYYLVVSRLVPYKRIDIAVEAFNLLKRPLIIVGEGRARASLEKKAGPTIRFLGRVPGEELVQLYARCKALIFPGREDFGIAPLEAQASGRPVIAYAAGGALETVLEGKTGLFFRSQIPEALAETVLEFERRATEFDPSIIRESVKRFDVKNFKRKLQLFVRFAIDSIKGGNYV